MRLRHILETMLTPQPSVDSDIKFPMEKELGEVVDAVRNYEEKTIQQFKDSMKSKMLHKNVTFNSTKGPVSIDVSDIEMARGDGSYSFVLKDSSGNQHVYKDGDIKIQNDNEAPVTSITQNTSKPSSSSQHKISQF